jgi:hypothetical protein
MSAEHETVWVAAKHGDGPPREREAVYQYEQARERSCSLHTRIPVYQYLHASKPGAGPFRWLADQLSSYHSAIWSLSPAVSVWVVTAAMLIFFFVVMPAVWSRDPARREAALAVLNSLLKFFRR